MTPMMARHAASLNDGGSSSVTSHKATTATSTNSRKHVSDTPTARQQRPESDWTTNNSQIPLERPHRTLSETRVYDPVSDKLRSGSLGSPTRPRTLSGHRPVRSISTCTDFVRGSGRVADKVFGSVLWNLETTRHTRPTLLLSYLVIFYLFIGHVRTALRHFSIIPNLSIWHQMSNYVLAMCKMSLAYGTHYWIRRRKKKNYISWSKIFDALGCQNGRVSGLVFTQMSETKSWK